MVGLAPFNEIKLVPIEAIQKHLTDVKCGENKMAEYSETCL